MQKSATGPEETLPNFRSGFKGDRSQIVATPGGGLGEGAGGGSLRFRRGKPSRPESRPHANAKMLGFAPLGLSDIGKVAGGFATRRAVTTIAPENPAVRDVERLALIQKQ
ncbi:MAG TPA: hypothetical protein VIU82_26470, partial [Bosea sp. (in: a-proteobacteria)]